ncbi:FAD:protein FMN transferase [Limnochorda pilosa]|uniref:FAD:protein FMN transferase n=1 Tax=Limnochorda pilosa TaxID=1555112 RepID=A0A0K2SKW5_LIMPI|nr:FAD:protein FMN transferase [Limnochorda pilosa]BAS27756.1 thiamine biosynthesis protein ApbE [Limnochorda pilosa]
MPPVAGRRKARRLRPYTASFRAMGTTVDLLVVSGEAEARVREGLRQAVELFARVERCCSRFRPESELSALNARPGRWVLVSKGLWELIRRAEDHRGRSRGLFDAGILPALEAAGYDRDFSRLDVAPLDVGAPDASTLDPQGTGARSGPWFTRTRAARLQLDPAIRAVRLEPGTRLDLGGVAKGWTVDRALERVAPLGPALVNAGGDLAARGWQGHPWRLTVEDPWHPERLLARLPMGDGAVATTSLGRRRWWKDGVVRHHVIDPRTGEPARTDALAVTAWADTAEAADVGAKVLLVLSPGEREDWLGRLGLMGALVVGSDGRAATLGRLPDAGVPHQVKAPARTRT